MSTFYNEIPRFKDENETDLKCPQKHSSTYQVANPNVADQAILMCNTCEDGWLINTRIGKVL